MAFWPFGKKKQQDEAAAESTPLAPATEGQAAEPAGGPETGGEVESGVGAELVEKQETASLPLAPGVEVLNNYDPVNGSTGPFDGDNVEIEDFDFSDFSDVTLNLGSVRVPLPKESQVQVEMGEQGPKMVHVVTRHGRITPVAFAAPRTGGLWEQSAEEIIQGMRSEGMPVEVQQGPWGKEIVGTGSNGVIRIIGVEGPRWLYRVTLAAPAGSEQALAETGRETIARSFVYRGEDPVLAGNSLQVVLPAQLAQQVQAAAEARARQAQEAAQAPANGNPNALSDALKQIIAQNADSQQQVQQLRDQRANGANTDEGGASASTAK